MTVLFATAELAPHGKVGGLADFSAGLTRMLRAKGQDVHVVLPDYGLDEFVEQERAALDVPGWVSPSTARIGRIGSEHVTLIRFPGSERPTPYLDRAGEPWPDLDRLFIGFSAAVAVWAEKVQPSVLHLNDWHTAATLGFSAELPPSVLTVHNLAYQGETGEAWLEKLKFHRNSFARHGMTNPLAGGVELADVVVGVSPHYVSETVEKGFGLEDLLEERGSSYVGILNGIDVSVWDPSRDPLLPSQYEEPCSAGKAVCKRALLEEIGWNDDRSPMVGMVTRLTEQKGVDLALEVVPKLVEIGSRMILLGSGDRALAESARKLAERLEGSFFFREGHDEALSHRIFGGSDLFLMPSRFEPAGLTQMQAMRYGVVPVVTDVGGLRDTVLDADAHPGDGNGFVASEVSEPAVSEALVRALDAWEDRDRWCSIVRRGMERDWSWDAPADRYIDVYRHLTSADR